MKALRFSVSMGFAALVAVLSQVVVFAASNALIERERDACLHFALLQVASSSNSASHSASSVEEVCGNLVADGS